VRSPKSEVRISPNESLLSNCYNQIGQSNGSYFLPPATPVVDLLSRNDEFVRGTFDAKAQRRGAAETQPEGRSE